MLLIVLTSCSSTCRLFLGGTLDEKCISIEVYENEKLISKGNDTCLMVNGVLGFSYVKKIETSFNKNNTISIQLPDTLVSIELKNQDLFCDYELSRNSANYNKFTCRKLKKNEKFY